MKEIWKDIIGHNNYQISSLGRVKIKARSYIDKAGISRTHEERFLVPKKWGVSVGNHPYKIETLMLRHFPEKFIKDFISNNTKDGEIWEDVVGYEGYYKVSNLGRVMSLPRITGIKIIKGTKTPSSKLGAILKPNRVGDFDKSGMYRLGVSLTKDGKSITKLVNRLVAEAFIPNPENLPEVNHINRDVMDNTVENLEWISSDINKQHALLSKESIIALYKLALKEEVSPSDMLLKLIDNYLL